MNSFIDLIQGLSKQLGYEIQIEDNTCAVGSDDITILLMGIVDNQEDTLVMTSQLGVPPPQRLEKLYEEMMNAMFSHGTTGGASFARNPSDGSIWIQRLEPIANLTPDNLISRISNLGEVATSWRTLINDFREAPVEAGSDTSSEGLSGFGNGFIQV